MKTTLYEVLSDARIEGKSMISLWFTVPLANVVEVDEALTKYTGRPPPTSTWSLMPYATPLSNLKTGPAEFVLP